MKSMQGKVLLGALALTMVGATATWAEGAQRVTFSKDILPIIQENCQNCHRPSGANLSGMIAPMSFMNYEETRPWAKAIAKSVTTLAMPPWGASPQHHGQFRNERSLTKEQIDTIVKWVEQRAPRGNPKDAPAPVQWPTTGWTVGGGEPDLVIAFEEANWVGDDVDDLYQNITVQLTKEQLPQDKWLQAIEFKPGSEVVHHIIAYASGGEDGAMTRGMLGGEAPGTDPATFPDGYGLKVPAGANVTFAMHYHKEAGPGTGVWDQSSLAIKFHDTPVTHQLEVDAIAHGAFEIPPQHANWKVGAAKVFEKDTTIMGFMPHLHLRGQEAKYTAYYPDGSSEVLLHVPVYDFNWQVSYEYDELKKIPAGTRIEFEMWYNNSLESAAAIGFNANRAVSFGGPTWDEMDLGWMTHTDTEPNVAASGDE